MDVLHSAGGEVVIQHEIDSFEVDSSGQQSCADQHPNFSGPETVHDVVSLKHKRNRRRLHNTVVLQRHSEDLLYNIWSACAYLLLCAVCVDHVHIDAFVHQLVEKLPRSVYWLHEHQHGRQETLKKKKECRKSKST